MEADVALLASAAIAEAALHGGMDTCLPFDGARRLPLLEVWGQVFDDCAEVRGWAPDTRNLAATVVEETLSIVQHRVSRVVGDRAGASFLAAFDTSTHQGRQRATCMSSTASGRFSGWGISLPGAPSMR